MANQYTTAEELGFPAKAERSKDAVRAEMLCQRLTQYALGTKDEEGNTVELDSTRVQAFKILIDKGKPNLQAVEQVNIDANDEMDHESLRSKLKAIVLSNPALLSEVMAELAKDQPGISPVKAA